LKIFNNYIKKLDLEDKLDIKFCKNTIARSAMQFSEEINQNGQFCGYTGVMKSLVPVQYREHNIQGVLNHEIGTHFLRKRNEWFQA